MGYLKGFGHGMGAGVVIGVLLAPRPGRETRAKLLRSYRRTRHTGEQMAARAQAGWRAAQPALTLAKQAAGTAGRVMEPMARTAGGRIAELTGRADSPAAPGPFFSTTVARDGDGT